MGLFDVFRPGEKKEKEEKEEPGLFQLPGPAKKSIAPHVERPAEKKDVFAIFSPKSEAPPSKGRHEPFRRSAPGETDVFGVWKSDLAPKSLEEAIVPESERGSVYRESPRPSYARSLPTPPPASMDIDPEDFARRLSQMFDLGALFDDVRSVRSTAAFRRAVEDAPHTGDPAELPMGHIASGPDVMAQLSRVFQVPESVLREDVLEDLFDLTTAAFEIMKPGDIPGWFQLTWHEDGRPEVDLEYLEVPVGYRMSGIFDIFKRKKPAAPPPSTLPAPIPGNLPAERPDVIYLPAPTGTPREVAKQDPFAIWSEEAQASEPGPETPDPFAVWQPMEAPAPPRETREEPSEFSIWAETPRTPSRGGRPQEISPFETWNPEAMELEAERLKQKPLFESLVPEGEKGSLYKKEVDPFQEFAPPAAPAAYPPPRQAAPARGGFIPPDPKTWKRESPVEVTRKGRRYYLPTTPRDVAERMLELYGEDGLERVYEGILGEREEPAWMKAYYEYAYSEGETPPPKFLLEHMSLHSGPSEIELISEFFNIPLDYLMSYLDPENPDDDMDGWQDLMDEALYPLYLETVPAAWRMLLPGLPGRFIIDSSEDDGCPELIYYEAPPEGTVVDDAMMERLEAEEEAQYARLQEEADKRHRMEEESRPKKKKKKKGKR